MIYNVSFVSSGPSVTGNDDDDAILIGIQNLAVKPA